MSCLQIQTNSGFISAPRNSRGAALLLGLVLLTALLLVGLVGINSMLFQQTMAGNFQQRLLARQAASVAERWAMAWLASAEEEDRILMELAITAPPLVEDLAADWWQEHSFPVGMNPVSGMMLEQPLGGTGLAARWLIKAVHTQPSESEPDTDISYYRVLSRGSAFRGNAGTGSHAVLEAIVVRPWPVEFESGPLLAPGELASPLEVFCAQFDAALPCGQVAWRQRK